MKLFLLILIVTILPVDSWMPLTNSSVSDINATSKAESASWIETTKYFDSANTYFHIRYFATASVSSNAVK